MERRTTGAIILAILAISAGVFVVLRHRPEPRLSVIDTAGSAKVPAPPRAMRGEEAARAAIERVRLELTHAFEEMPIQQLPPAHESLTQSVVSLLDVYLRNDAAGFLAGMPGRGFDVPRGWADPAAFASEFNSRNSLKDAVLLDSSVMVRWRWRGGVEQPLQVSHRSTDCATRHALPAGMTDPEQDRLDIVEFVLPIQVPNVSGDYHEGLIGLSAIWRTSDRKWYVFKVCLYDVASDDFLLLPPI